MYHVEIVLTSTALIVIEDAPLILSRADLLAGVSVIVRLLDGKNRSLTPSITIQRIGGEFLKNVHISWISASTRMEVYRNAITGGASDAAVEAEMESRRDALRKKVDDTEVTKMVVDKILSLPLPFAIACVAAKICVVLLDSLWCPGRTFSAIRIA